MQLCKCAFCHKETILANAQDQGWEPNFYITEDQAADRAACPECAKEHLIFDDHEDPILKPGHEFKVSQVTLCDQDGHKVQVPIFLSAGKLRVSLPEGAEVYVSVSHAAIFTGFMCRKPDEGHQIGNEVRLV